MTLVDSNVLLDVFSESEPWVAWSKQQLARAARRGPVVINDVIYAEISVRFTSFESLDAVLKKIVIGVRRYPVQHYFLPEGIPTIPKCGRPENRRVVRFLYWCPCHNSEHPDRYSR